MIQREEDDLQSMSDAKPTTRSKHQPSISITYFLASLICGLTGSLGVYDAVNTKPQYSDLIAGNLGWNNASKAKDFALVLSLIAITIGMYWILEQAGKRIHELAGRGMLLGHQQLLQLAMVPACLGLAMVFLHDSHDRSLLFLSTLLVLLSTVLSIRSARQGWPLLSGSKTLEFVGSLVGAVLLGAMSGLGVMIANSRGPIPSGTVAIESVWKAVAIGGIAGFVLIFLATQRSRNQESKITSGIRVAWALALVQLGLPLLFRSLIPPAPINSGIQWHGDVLSQPFWILVWVLIAAGYIDVIRRLVVQIRAPKSGISWMISPMSLLAVMSVLAIHPAGHPVLHTDDYHWGEFVVPFWTLSEFGWLPYQDYTPARGLMNYVPGFIASVFADGSAASFTTTAPIVALGYHAIALGVLIRVLGRDFGVLFALMLPITGIAEIQILVACSLLILTWGTMRWRPSSWLIWWVVIGTMMVLYAPGQGGLIVLATMPLGFWNFYRALRNEIGRLLKHSLIFGVVALGLMTLTPIGPMVQGAVRYGMEQGSINSVAHATPWDNPAAPEGIPWRAGKWPMPMPHMMFEAMRAGFPVFATLSGLMVLYARRNYRGARRTLVMSLATCVFAYLTLMTFRSLGRIDASSPSRTIMPTLFAATVAIPVLIRYAASSTRRVPMMVSLMPFAFLVALASGAKLQPLNKLASKSMVRQQSVEMTDGTDIGAPSIGRVSILNERHIQRIDDIQSLTSTLNSVLNEGEGYVDLTNRSAMHFFLDRMPGLNTTSIYNTVHHDQQMRAIHAIIDRGIDVAVADPNRNLPWDGGGPSLRAPLVWRYLVQRMTPMMADGWCLLVDPDRLDESARAQSISRRIELLEAVFPVRPYAWLPHAWGRSSGTLRDHAYTIVSTNDIVPRHGLIVSEDDASVFEVQSNPVVFEIDLGEVGVRGSDAGLLILHLEIPDGMIVPASIGWSLDSEPSASGNRAEDARLTCLLGSGDHIIPLDASARWLLGNVDRLTIKLDHPPIGTRIVGLRAQLAQRDGSDEIDRLAQAGAGASD
jgi:hypothetical protein